MKPEVIKKIKAMYPETEYNVVKSQGSLIVSPKKVQIRLYQEQVNRTMNNVIANGSEAISTRLEELIDRRKLTEKDFEQTQLFVYKTCRDRIASEAKKCKVRKIVYLERLLR